MSIKIMTRVWDSDLPTGEKMVLLALADCANDAGLCWPSIATIAKKCSRTERGVQIIIKSLVANGHLSREEVHGRGVNYTVHPRNHFTPELSSPPKPFRGTPETISPKPSRTVIDMGVKRARAWECPDGVDPQHWQDFLRNRKSKRCPNTETAYQKMLNDCAKLEHEGFTIGELVRYAAERGWAAIYSPNGRSNGNGQYRQGGSAESAGISNPMVRAIAARRARRLGEHGEDDGLRLSPDDHEG